MLQRRLALGLDLAAGRLPRELRVGRLEGVGGNVYALGKNPKKLAELASIKDPVRFAVAVAKLETQLKVSTRKPPPPPPKITSGSAPVSGSVDSTLERLRAEAERTGDYTKVIQYKRSKRQ